MKNIIEKFDEKENEIVKEAIKEAQKQKGKINKELLNKVKEFFDNIDDYEDHVPMSIIYSIYLLSEFKDKKLFPILIDMYSKDSIGMQDIIIEQYLNSKLERIIISVFDGDFKALNSIIENKEINEITRESFLI